MVVQLVLSFQNDAAYVAALEALNRLGVTVRRTAPLFRTVAVTVPERLVQQMQALPGLVQAVRDVPVRPACCEMDVARALGFYPEARAGPARSWEDFTVLEPAAIAYMRVPEGLTGKGVRVAVVDTGVNATHQALRGRVKQHVAIADGDPNDGVGHGTHVAGTIAGQEVDSPRGPWRGIAPDAEIVNIAVLDNSGDGTLSDVLAGFEAAAAAKVHLVNASLGTPVDFLIDPLASAIDVLAERGILVVAAAGNSGPAPFTVGTPGSAPNAVTVGAASVPIPSYLPGGETAEFSSRGPTLRSGYKPDVAAPGGAGGAAQRPQMIYGPSTGTLDAVVDGVEDEWAPLRGSSMSTPHVTGLLALLMERYRFTRAQLLDGLAATSRRGAGWRWGGRDFEQGWGFVDGVALAQYFATRRG